MVAPHHHDRVAGAAGLLQRVEDAAELVVHERRRGEVAAHERPPLVHVPQRLQPRLGELPVQVPREPRRVGPVVVADRRQRHAVGGELVEPRRRGKARDVRQAEPAGDEERPVLWRPVQRVDGGVGDLVVGAVGVALGERPPVHERVRRAGEVGEAHLRPPHPRRRPPLAELGGPVLRADGPVVVDLPAGEREVPGAGERLRERDAVTRRRRGAEARREPVDAGGGGAEAGEEAGARRVAERCLAVGVGERGAAGGEAVEVRGERLRVAVQVADPVVEVVDGDEEHVRPRRRRTGDEREHEEGGEGAHRVSRSARSFAASRENLQPETGLQVDRDHDQFHPVEVRRPHGARVGGGARPRVEHGELPLGGRAGGPGRRVWVA